MTSASDLPPVLGIPPDGPCPDCEAPAGRWCFPWCPRFQDFDLPADEDNDDHL